MEIAINIKPHLKKFLLKYFNTSEPIPILSNNVHAKVFIAVAVVHPDAYQKFTKEEYNESIKFKLNYDLGRARPKPRELQKMNIYFDKLFKEMLYQWALSSLCAGDFASTGIRNFLSYYNISEDEYSWSVAHRAWQRYHKREYVKSRAAVS